MCLLILYWRMSSSSVMLNSYLVLMDLKTRYRLGDYWSHTMKEDVTRTLEMCYLGQSPQFGTKRYGVTWKSLLFSECFYQKKLLHVFSNMVMEYKNIAGQAPTLLLNPGARVKVLDMSRRNVFSIALIYAWFLFFFFIFKLLLTLLDMILCKEQHFQIYYTMQ